MDGRMDGFWVVEENWKFWVVSSRCDKSVRATLLFIVHLRASLLFAGQPDRWITGGGLSQVSWSAGRLLSVSWERADHRAAIERVPGQHEVAPAVVRRRSGHKGLQWGEFLLFDLVQLGGLDCKG